MTEHSRNLYIILASMMFYTAFAGDAYEFVKLKTNNSAGALALTPFYIIVIPVVWVITKWRNRNNDEA